MKFKEENIWLPMAAAVLLVILFMGVIGMAVISGETPVLISAPEKSGFDYRDFYMAAKLVQSGGNPWEWERFVSPPVSAFVNIALLQIPIREAIRVFFFINIACVLAAALLYQQHTHKTPVLSLASVTVIAVGYPFFFVLQRGNIDGVVFFLLALALYVMMRQGQSRYWEAAAGLFIAIAVHIKLYPILLLIPLALGKQWRPLAWTFLFMTILFFLSAALWPDFIAKLMQRIEIFDSRENGSIVNSIFLFSAMFIPQPAELLNTIKIVSFGLYGILLAVNILLDIKMQKGGIERDAFEIIIWYLPFMIIIPSIVFHYEYIHLLPFLVYLPKLTRLTLHTPWTGWLLGLGFVLSQMQVSVLYHFTGNMAYYGLPGLGVLLIIAVGFFTKSFRIQNRVVQTTLH